MLLTHDFDSSLGVINHGREVVAFIDVHQWGHDSNFTINVLPRTFSHMDVTLMFFLTNGQLLARKQKSICVDLFCCPYKIQGL